MHQIIKEEGDDSMVCMIPVRWLPVIIKKYADGLSEFVYFKHRVTFAFYPDSQYFHLFFRRQQRLEVYWFQMMVANGGCNFAVAVAHSPPTKSGFSQSELRFTFQSP